MIMSSSLVPDNNINYRTSILTALKERRKSIEEISRDTGIDIGIVTSHINLYLTTKDVYISQIIQHTTHVEKRYSLTRSKEYYDYEYDPYYRADSGSQRICWRSDTAFKPSKYKKTKLELVMDYLTKRRLACQ